MQLSVGGTEIFSWYRSIKMRGSSFYAAFYNDIYILFCIELLYWLMSSLLLFTVAGGRCLNGAEADLQNPKWPLFPCSGSPPSTELMFWRCQRCNSKFSHMATWNMSNILLLSRQQQFASNNRSAPWHGHEAYFQMQGFDASSFSISTFPVFYLSVVVCSLFVSGYFHTDSTHPLPVFRQSTTSPQ